MVRQTCQTVRRREQLELLILLAQRLVDAIELGAAVTQSIHHVIEHIGEISDLATTRRSGQVDGQITGSDFSGSFGKAIERTRNQSPETIRGGGDSYQQEDNHTKCNVAEAANL